MTIAANRLFTVVLAVCGLAAVLLTWTRVVQMLSDARPIGSSTARSEAIVWDDRVFSSRAALAGWLKSHGGDYRRWRIVHPAAAAVLEDRPAPRSRAGVKPAPPAAVSKRPAPTPARRHAPAPVQPRVVGARGGWLVKLLVAVLLAAVVALFAAAMLAPRVYAARFPLFAARLAPRRAPLGAVAAAVFIGLVVGALVR